MRSRRLPPEAFRSQSRSFSDQLQFGAIVEHRVIADERQASPNGGCRYPQIAGVQLLVEWVARVLAGEPQAGERRRCQILGRQDEGRAEQLLKVRYSTATPPSA